MNREELIADLKTLKERKVNLTDDELRQLKRRRELQQASLYGKDEKLVDSLEQEISSLEKLLKARRRKRAAR